MGDYAVLRRCRSKADRAAEPLARAVLRPKLTLVWGCLLVNERTALLARRAWRASTAAVHPYLTRVVPHGGTERGAGVGVDNKNRIERTSATANLGD